MNPTLITQPTRCKLCNHIFQSDLLGTAAIVGGNPQAKLQQVNALMKPLMKHLQSKHPDAIQNAQMAGAEFAGYLMVTGAFELDAATFEKLGADFTRWNVHKLTARKEAVPSDERIRERVAMVLAEPATERMLSLGNAFEVAELHRSVEALLIEMRDSIVEKDRFPTRQPVPNGQPN